MIVSAAALVQDAHPEVVRWAINAVIIGGVLTEVVVRLLQAGAPGLRPVSVPPAAAAGAGEAPPP